AALDDLHPISRFLRIPFRQEFGHRSFVSHKEQVMSMRTWAVVIHTAAALSVSVMAQADDHRDVCSARELHGTYVFAARGFTIVAGVAQPKAIVEVIDFNGDGTLSVPAATRS